MKRQEQGSELIQAAVVLPLVFLVVFAVVQAGGYMLSISRLCADLSRASFQVDVPGLALAGSKEAFVKTEILGASTQLGAERLRVYNVELDFVNKKYSSVSEPFVGRGSAGNGGGYNDWVEPPWYEATITQDVDSSKLSFDVEYDVPLVVTIPGIDGLTMRRHINCGNKEDEVIEVELALL